MPLPENFNRGTMAAIEKQVVQLVAEGRLMKVDVRPVYTGNDPIPTSITIKADTIRTNGKVPAKSLKRDLPVPRPKRPPC